MLKILFGATAAALVLTAGMATAQSQQGAQSGESESGTMMGEGQSMPMMRQHDRGGMMHGGRGMMRGGMGHGMGPHMMLMMMAMVDADGSETLSLEEVQAVHARMFNYVDADGDGELTLDEMRAFMHGGEAAPAQ